MHRFPHLLDDAERTEREAGQDDVERAAPPSGALLAA
jgi:hypothetical protein